MRFADSALWRRCAWGFAAAMMSGSVVAMGDPAPVWQGYAGDPQHTAVSSIPSVALDNVRWSTPVDLQRAQTNGDLLIHYGSPAITAANTVIVPVKTTSDGGFEVEALNGANGNVIWSQNSDYTLPPHGWTPSYQPTLTPTNGVYFAGNGGTVYYRPNANSATGAVSQLCFYGMANYTGDESDYNNSVFINTPITSDSAGDIYFGFRVNGSNPLGLASGIARIAPNGSATYVSTAAASNNNNSVNTPTMNCAPALSNDGKTLYITLNNAGGGGNGIFPTGEIVALNSSTLQYQSSAPLIDPSSGQAALLPDDGTASPMVGPDGQVYIGVLENPFPLNHDRGWMLQFNGNLSSEGTPGAFGWDDTASVVPASMVASYQGTSKYLLMTKYNNYAGFFGSTGQNEIAILDPNATEVDPVTGTTVMNKVETMLGPTPNTENPGGVREWCINTAVVDPATDSVLVNSEDGVLYRWDLGTNTLSQSLRLTDGLGEAYTPTMIAADGSVLAIQDSQLFDVAVPEPGSAGLLAICCCCVAWRRAGRTRHVNRRFRGQRKGTAAVTCAFDPSLVQRLDRD